MSAEFDAAEEARGLVNAQRFDLDKYACSRGSRVEVAYEALCESLAAALTDAYQRGRCKAFEDAAGVAEVISAAIRVLAAKDGGGADNGRLQTDAANSQRGAERSEASVVPSSAALSECCPDCKGTGRAPEIVPGCLGGRWTGGWSPCANKVHIGEARRSFEEALKSSAARAEEKHDAGS